MFNRQFATQALVLGGLVAAMPLLSACDKQQLDEKGNWVNPDRYAFSTRIDPRRGEMVSIFDKQTGEYFIKTIISDPKGGKMYSVWNQIPLSGSPKVGISEFKKGDIDLPGADAPASAATSKN